MGDTPKPCKHKWHWPTPVHFNGIRDGWSTRTHHVTWCDVCGALGVRQKISNKHSNVSILLPDYPLYKAAQQERANAAEHVKALEEVFSTDHLPFSS